MAKGNGGTRSQGPRNTITPENGLRTYQSYGDRPIEVDMEDGFPMERARDIMEQIERLSDIYEIPVKKIVLLNKNKAREGSAAYALQEDGVLTFSLSDGSRRTTYGNIVAQNWR